MGFLSIYKLATFDYSSMEEEMETSSRRLLGGYDDLIAENGDDDPTLTSSSHHMLDDFSATTTTSTAMIGGDGDDDEVGNGDDDDSPNTILLSEEDRMVSLFEGGILILAFFWISFVLVNLMKYLISGKFYCWFSRTQFSTGRFLGNALSISFSPLLASSILIPYIELGQDISSLLLVLYYFYFYRLCLLILFLKTQKGFADPPPDDEDVELEKSLKGDEEESKGAYFEEGGDDDVSDLTMEEVDIGDEDEEEEGDVDDELGMETTNQLPGGKKSLRKRKKERESRETKLKGEEEDEEEEERDGSSSKSESLGGSKGLFSSPYKYHKIGFEDEEDEDIEGRKFPKKKKHDLLRYRSEHDPTQDRGFCMVLIVFILNGMFEYFTKLSRRTASSLALSLLPQKPYLTLSQATRSSQRRLSRKRWDLILFQDVTPSLLLLCAITTGFIFLSFFYFDYFPFDC